MSERQITGINRVITPSRDAPLSGYPAPGRRFTLAMYTCVTTGGQVSNVPTDPAHWSTGQLVNLWSTGQLVVDW